MAVQGQRQCCSKCCDGSELQLRDNSLTTSQQLNSDISTQRQHDTIVEEPEKEAEEECRLRVNKSPPLLLNNEDFILVDLYEIKKDDSVTNDAMASRPVSRLGPVLTRETNTPKLKSMIVVPTELVMTGAPITAAHRLQNRHAVHHSSSSRNYHDDEGRHSEMNSSRFNESRRQNGSRRMTYNLASQLSSLASPSSAHVNESFVHSSDDDDDDAIEHNDLNSVTSDDSDLARSPAADIIRATYTSPMFDVSNQTMTTHLESTENSVEPCPVDGCPLNPKTRVSL